MAKLIAGSTIGGKEIADKEYVDSQVTTNFNTLNTTITSHLTEKTTKTSFGHVKIGSNIDVTDGTISVANASTNNAGVVQLNNTLTSTSTSQALTAAQGKVLKDLVDTKANNTDLTQLQQTVNSHSAEKATLTELGHVNHGVLTATLGTNWSGSEAPYTQTISVSGILATDNPIIDIVMSGNYSTDESRIEAWGHVYRAVTSDGSITFYATEIPQIEIPIQIKVVR